MCKELTRQFPEDGRNILKILCIKYIINTEVHLLVIYKFWIRFMNGRWNISLKMFTFQHVEQVTLT